MSQMIDLIRRSAVPANLMRSASRGALSLPAAEMLEILVLLTSHPLFGEQARLTLAGWDEAATARMLSDPQAPSAVLEYYSAAENLRPQLLPAILENPAVSEARLAELARILPRDQLTRMAASKRVRCCPGVVGALLARPDFAGSERAQLEAQLRSEQADPAAVGNSGADAPRSDSPQSPSEPGAESAAAPSTQEILEPELTEYLHVHSAEIAAEAGQPFRLVDWTTEEQAAIAETAAPAPGLNQSGLNQSGLNQSGMNQSTAAARALGGAARKERERISPMQRIARMSIGERIQFAYKGGHEDRFILIRDGAKLVSGAVLESPKLTDSEVETFAGMKNVGEHVLRIIASKRKFMRNYAVKRILTTNPRCPIDVAMPLLKELLVSDLKNLMANKNVSDTIRNFAFKMWKDKAKAQR